MLNKLFHSNNTFEGILPGEKTIFLIRKHKLFFYYPIVIFFILAFLPVIIFYLNINFFKKFIDLIIFLYFLYLMILNIFLFTNLLIYSLTTFIITNKRVIKIEEKNLFDYERTEISFDKIENINVKIKGLLGNILKYGQISIETAGKENDIFFDYLPQPLDLKNKIIKIKNLYLKNLEENIDKFSLDLFNSEDLFLFSKDE